MAFVEDTLLHANSLSHHGDLTTEDEELTPTLETFIVLTWLRSIHPELPKLAKQRYGTELQMQTHWQQISPQVEHMHDQTVHEGPAHYVNRLTDLRMAIHALRAVYLKQLFINLKNRRNPCRISYGIRVCREWTRNVTDG